jgi:diguanylate cyclase (GGDEF)-like protein
MAMSNCAFTQWVNTMSLRRCASRIDTQGLGRLIVAGLFASLLLFQCAYAEPLSADESSRLLKNADIAKASNYAEFVTILDRLTDQAVKLPPDQYAYFRYLKAWQNVYEGDYQSAIATLRETITQPDKTLRFRASATMVNVMVLGMQYEDAYEHLSRLLELLPQIEDKGAREQGLAVLAYYYNHVGEQEISLRYARMLAEENWGGRGVCTGGHLELQALYKDSKLQSTDPRFQTVIDACNKLGEPIRATAAKTYKAGLQIQEGRYDDAIRLLLDHYASVKQTRSPRMMSEYDELLAQAYRQTGNSLAARDYALRTIESSVKSEYTEPLVGAYRLLYLQAKEQGDTKTALAYHEKYMTADKGHIDDISARQLAYQRVKHQVDANRLQIEALNKQNEVLQLQGSLADKAVETSRLYIVMLVMGLAFVAFMAYRTKRSQMHFMNLSRLDGLTGLTNRPHFLELAENALKESQRTGQSICAIICDLDYFKRINDTCGHAAGDSALRLTASVFQAHLRKQDIVGRLGGEEFGMLLIDCDVATAFQRCDRIRQAISEISISNGDTAFPLAASFGIAITTSSGHDLRQLMADADAALYQAKLGGRNRVVAHNAGRSSVAPQTNDGFHPARA